MGKRSAVAPIAMHVLTCHLCGKEKKSTSYGRALYVLAFHYDRRHRGWTDNATEEAG